MKRILLLFLLLPAFVIAGEALPKGVIQLDGSDAPPLVLKSMEGHTYDLATRKGRWVFVHFWATWCGPCRREMPTIQALFNIIDQSKVEIALINTAESEDLVFNFLGIVAPDLIPLMDTDGMVTERWQPRGLPATFLVDPQGKLRYLVLGGRDWREEQYINFLKNLK